MDPWWNIHVPLPVLLATVTTLGYMVGRWRRSGELCPRCKQALKHQAATPDTIPAVEAAKRV
jgi:hypothetical protein